MTPEPQPLTPEEIAAEHRRCVSLKYGGCYSHWVHHTHCRADGMAWPAMCSGS